MANWVGPTKWSYPHTRLIQQTADVAVTNQTLTNLTGMSFAVEANVFYTFDFFIWATASTGGLDMIAAATGISTSAGKIALMANTVSTPQWKHFDLNGQDIAILSHTADIANAGGSYLDAGLVRIHGNFSGNATSTFQIKGRKAAAAAGTVTFSDSYGWISDTRIA
jgi:hypothetical protein